MPLDDETSKHLEINFHTATYHVLTEIVEGLRTVIGDLVGVSLV